MVLDRPASRHDSLNGIPALQPFSGPKSRTGHGSHNQSLASPLSATTEHGASRTGPHARAESVGVLPLSPARLVGSLHVRSPAFSGLNLRTDTRPIKLGTHIFAGKCKGKSPPPWIPGWRCWSHPSFHTRAGSLRRRCNGGRFFFTPLSFSCGKPLDAPARTVIDSASPRGVGMLISCG